MTKKGFGEMALTGTVAGPIFNNMKILISVNFDLLSLIKCLETILSNIFQHFRSCPLGARQKGKR